MEMTLMMVLEAGTTHRNSLQVLGTERQQGIEEGWGGSGV